MNLPLVIRTGCTLAMLSLSPLALADHVTDIGHANMRVRASESGVVSGELICAVEVELVEDDSARNTTIVVVLPPDVGAVSTSATAGKCTLGPVHDGPHGPVVGHVICNVGILNPGGPKIAAVKLSAKILSKTKWQPTCSYFVYSDLGDSVPANNFAPR